MQNGGLIRIGSAMSDALSSDHLLNNAALTSPQPFTIVSGVMSTTFLSSVASM